MHQRSMASDSGPTVTDGHWLIAALPSSPPAEEEPFETPLEVLGAALVQPSSHIACIPTQIKPSSELDRQNTALYVCR